MMEAKRFFLKMVLFAPVVLLMSGMNYVVDPAHYFHGENVEKKMAQLLLEGKNVAASLNYNGRFFQKYIVESQREKKDVLVLGSSRTMLVSANMLKTTRFFNHSVSAALLEDFIALYEISRGKNRVPHTVILGLDPWLLNKNTRLDDWKSLKTYYEKGASRLGLKEKRVDYLGLDRLVPDAYLKLFSPVYFKKSLLTIKSRSKKEIFYATEQNEGNDPIIHPDGSYSYEKEKREKSVEDVREAAYNYVNVKPVYSLESFTELDKDAQKKLENFVIGLQKDGVNVIFFLSPYHPVTYRLLVASQNYKIILDAQNYYKNLAQKNGIVLIGSYDPGALSCREGDFYDGMHPKPEAIERILKPFLKSIVS